MVPPGVQLAVAQPPREEGRFRANVVVTVQRYGPEFTLESAKAGLEQRKAALPELEEIAPATSSWRTAPGSRASTATPSRGDPLSCRRHATLIARGEVATDVIEIVGSCGAEDADAEIEVVRAIQDSVRVYLD